MPRVQSDLPKLRGSTSGSRTVARRAESAPQLPTLDNNAPGARPLALRAIQHELTSTAAGDMLGSLLEPGNPFHMTRTVRMPAHQGGNNEALLQIDATTYF